MQAIKPDLRVVSQPSSRLGRPRVLIVEDHLIVRQMLAQFVRDRLQADVCGECANGADAARLAQSERPNIVLLDWILPDGRAYDLLLRAKREKWPTRFVVLTGTEEPAAARAAIAAGATAFVLKRSGCDALEQGIRHATADTCFLCPLSASLLARAVFEHEGADSPQLSPRETEVLRLLTQGRSPKEIAGVLGTSPKTVNNQLASLKEKLNIWETAGLVRHAMKIGLG